MRQIMSVKNKDDIFKFKSRMNLTYGWYETIARGKDKRLNINFLEIFATLNYISDIRG